MQEHLAICFPVRIKLVFEKNTAYPSLIISGRNAQIIQNRPIRWVEETHVSLERDVDKLEAGASSTLFTCENWVRFWKEYCLPIGIFKGKKCTFCSKFAYSPVEETHVSLKRNPYKIEAGASSNFFSSENILIFERNTTY
jgi:hypothetical protein